MAFSAISGNLATQYPQAVGLGDGECIARRYAYFRRLVRRRFDGGGDFHSAMTFAAVYNAPVIMQVVNNQWAISSFPASQAASARPLRHEVLGYGIASLRVDGNDPLAVYAAMRWAADRARTNNGPTLIEYFTYRAEGHSTSDDPGAYRAAQRV